MDVDVAPGLADCLPVGAVFGDCGFCLEGFVGCVVVAWDDLVFDDVHVLLFQAEVMV